MSIVKDLSLAPSGLQKIQWVRDFMPALGGIEERFRREKPFAGPDHRRLCPPGGQDRQPGAGAPGGGRRGASHRLQPPVHPGRCGRCHGRAWGWRPSASTGWTWRGYEDLLTETLKCRPHLIVDDGGDLISLLGGQVRSTTGTGCMGGCEETTTGIHRLYARERAGILPCPMMAVNDAKAKHYYDNKYGTGQSTWDAIMHTTNLMVAGKTVVVAGYGWCGKGIAMRAKGMGANVIVTEVDPFKALEATMENFRVMPMDEAARYGDIFVTATGCKDVIVERHFQVMKHNVLLCNSGHFDCEVDVARLGQLAEERFPRRAGIEGFRLPDGRVLNVLAEGRLVNLAAGNGHPAEIMDMSFAVQALSLEWMARHAGKLEKKVYNVPEEIDDQIGRVKLAAMGLSIDTLTQEQKDYLAGWEA